MRTDQLQMKNLLYFQRNIFLLTLKVGGPNDVISNLITACGDARAACGRFQYALIFAKMGGNLIKHQRDHSLKRMPAQAPRWFSQNIMKEWNVPNMRTESVWRKMEKAEKALPHGMSVTGSMFLAFFHRAISQLIPCSLHIPPIVES